jgi:3-oxoacyl-[acyl-carrier protein] reductase
MRKENNPMDLKEKVALITGASSGIGQAVAIELAKNGANIVVNYCHSVNGAKQTVNQIDQTGQLSLMIQADVTKEDQVKSMVQKVIDTFGRIDILIANSGGIIERAKIAEMSNQLWHSMLDLNLTSVFMTCRAVIPYMLEQHYGNIITISSIASKSGGGPGAVPYATAKAAIEGFTKGLAKELIDEGIRVNAVSPGVIKTGFFRNTPADVVKKFEASIPMKRMGKPEEVAQLVHFLVSNQASYITGMVYDITGGMMV